MRTHTLTALFLAAVASVALVTSCSPDPGEKHFIIGVSQCSDDAWRTKMNEEMERELIFLPDMELHIRQAQDNSTLQCHQIDSFIREGVDLLIVSPNEAEEVKPAVTRAYEMGIPVVVADRRVSGDQWTAFLGGDNLEVGLLIGDWLCKQSEKGPLTMLEICGLPGSTPAVWRHKGMMDRIGSNPRIRVAGSAMGRWFRADAEHVTDSLLRLYPETDIIVAHNDQMAIGASAAAQALGLHPTIIGVDALTGEGNGIEAILDGRLQMSASYASRGDLVLATAAHILHGEPYLRDTVFRSALVDREAALPLQLQADMMAHNIEALRTVQGKMLHMGDEFRMQRIMIYSLVALVALLVVLVCTLWAVWEYRLKVRREREKQEEKLRKQEEQLKEITAELAATKAQLSEEDAFIKRLEREIEQRMSDPELDVEQLSAQLGMSRTALYRKVKSAMGQSPVELIRHIRLHKAQQMLRLTDANVQQVAYEVGFSAPSYFAKCYREEFGISPAEESRKNTKK